MLSNESFKFSTNLALSNKTIIIAIKYIGKNCNVYEKLNIPNILGLSPPSKAPIDFVVNSGGKRTYIQSAYAMPTDEKAEIELRPFMLTGDSFPKIVVRKDIGKRWYDDVGILNINLIDFLLDKELI